jgi:hypothetical protein
MEGITNEILREIDNEVRMAIRKLSIKYKLNEKDALKYILQQREIPLPYLGKAMIEWCQSIKYNNGLYSQCINTKDNNSEYCKDCKRELDETGKLYCGDIKERDKWENGKDKDGNQLTSYENILEQLNITNEAVEKEAEKNGVKLVKEEKKRGRPLKKEKGEEKEKKPRGRPPTPAKHEIQKKGEDLISRLLEEAKAKGKM